MDNEETFQIFSDFMDANSIIKDIISDCEPKPEDGYNEESIIKYQDKLLKSLQAIQSQLDKILACFKDSIQDKLHNESLHNKIKMIFNTYKETLLNCTLTYDNLKYFYQTCFANMNKELTHELREKCKGYTMFNGSFFPSSFLKKATSISDILHIFHICFMNNENRYRAIPIIEQKPTEYDEEYKITLRGVPNETAKKIYDNIPEKVGITDIVAFPNGKIIMMIRDVGHATTIEIEDVKDDGQTWIRYYIPKICNLDMVKKIDGCSIYNDKEQNPKFATGSMNTRDAAKDVIDLIEKIPTDEDMILYNRGAK